MEEATASLAALADRYCWGCPEFEWEDVRIGNEFLYCCDTPATQLNSLISIYDTAHPTPEFAEIVVVLKIFTRLSSRMLVIHHRKDPNKMRELKPIMRGSVTC